MTTGLEPVRRRVRLARSILVGGAIVAFAATMGLARTQFPGITSTAWTTLSPPASFVDVVRRNQLEAGILAPGRGSARHRLGAVVSRAVFRSMGCAVVVEAASADGARRRVRCSSATTRVFSRFRPAASSSLLNAPAAGMSPLFRDVPSRSRSGRRRRRRASSTPCVGGAVVAAGYDRDFTAGLDSDEPAAARSAARRPPTARPGSPPGARRAARLTASSRRSPSIVRAAFLEREGFVSAGGDLATRGFVDVALSGGDAVR